jgi:hypothetical protein
VAELLGEANVRVLAANVTGSYEALQRGLAYEWVHGFSNSRGKQGDFATFLAARLEGHSLHQQACAYPRMGAEERKQLLEGVSSGRFSRILPILPLNHGTSSIRVPELTITGPCQIEEGLD